MHPCNLGCTVLVTLWAVWVLMVFIAKYYCPQIWQREADTLLNYMATKVGKVKDNDVLHLASLVGMNFLECQCASHSCLLG